jgi:hypothetical protein
MNKFAAEEPRQLGVLINWFSNDPNNDAGAAPDAFNCATNDLIVGKTVGKVLFNFDSLVGGVFQNIVANADAGNSGAVQAQLDVVNNYSCCNVLPDLDVIWLDSAKSAHLQIEVAGLQSGVASAAPCPAACSANECNTQSASDCASEDNDGLGIPGN